MAKLTDKFFNRVIEGPLELEAGEKIKGDLELASGDVAKIFENIVDKDGHARFDEGNGADQTITGFTYTYHKWALSGTHLLLVVAGNIADATTIATSTNVGYFKVPKWILDKIYPSFLNNIEVKVIQVWNDDYSNQNITVVLEKKTDGIVIRTAGSFTSTKARSLRVEFDLLIDNE